MSIAPGPASSRHEIVKQHFYAHAVLAETRRYRQLDRYDAHYACTQYAHLQHDWWGQNADALETVSADLQVGAGFVQPVMAMSVRMMRPTTPSNLSRAIVDRFTGLLFGETRKPDLTVEGDEATEQWLHSAMEQCRFWSEMRKARTIGGAAGSVLMTVQARTGKFSLEVHSPKHCQVVWKDRRRLEPEAVLVLYKYQVAVDVVDPKTNEVKGSEMVDYLYRRIITEMDDTVYEPVRLEPGVALDWVVQNTVPHGMGFFPGVWIQNLPDAVNEDGHPDCQGAWQSFDTYDRMLSQMNKAVLLNLDPTVVLAFDPKTIASQGGVRKGSDNALSVGPGGSANYMEITGSGVATGQTMLAVLKQNILDLVRCVMVDAATIGGAAQSAKAIEYIYAPMLEKSDDLRAQYGDLGIIPMLKLLEAIGRQLSGKSVRLGKDAQGNDIIGQTAFDLPPTPSGKPPMLGPGGFLRLKWGPYFSPTEDDRTKAISNAVAACAGGIISKETAIQQGAPLFGVRDTEAEAKKIKLEQDADMAGMMGPDLESDESIPEETAEPVVNAPAAGQGGKP